LGTSATLVKYIKDQTNNQEVFDIFFNILYLT